MNRLPLYFLLCLGLGLLACSPSSTPFASPVPTPTPTTLSVLLTHGPITGAVTFDSANIWGRTNAPAQVKIEYATSPNFGEAKFTGEQSTSAPDDFTFQVPLRQLTAETTYYVNVWVNGARMSRPGEAWGGRFKTFPPETQFAPFKMVVLSDFGYFYQTPNSKDPSPVKTFASADAENPDFVFIGGDFDHRDPKLLPDKRKMFQDLYADDPTSPLYEFTKYILHRYPLAHQWDDHDYGADNSDRTAVFRDNSLKVFKEYFPSYPLGKYGIYQSLHYGKDVDVFVLDNRYDRDPNQMPDGPDKSMLNGQHYPDGQTQWLLDGLRDSTATWKLVMSSSAFSDSLGKTDSWARFGYERNEIIQFVHDNKIGGVVVIAGDLHAGAMDNGQNAELPSVVVPSVNLDSCFTVTEGKVGTWSQGIYGDTGRDKKNTPCPGYGVVTINGARAHLQIKDSDGNVKLDMTLDPQSSYAPAP